MKKQNKDDRLKRLAEGRCPVHGLTMTQVGLADNGRRFVVACPRMDCDIEGHSEDPFGPVTLTPSSAHLLA